MTNVHLLEASAGTVQLDITHDLFDNEGVVMFDKLVRKGAAARKYMWLISEFVEMIERRSDIRERVGHLLSFLLWTSLQGCRSDPHEPELSPVAFFQAAADFVTRHPNKAGDLDQVRQLVDEFCASWKLPLPAVTMAANYERVKKRADRFVLEWQAIDAAAPTHFVDIFVALREANLRLTTQIQKTPELYFVGRFYAHAILMGHLPALRVDIKFEDNIYTAFTPGQPCLAPPVWEKAAFYSAMMSLLINGRCKFPIPHLEQQAFEFMTDELGLRLDDSIF
jgi:hypothetical protein